MRVSGTGRPFNDTSRPRTSIANAPNETSGADSSAAAARGRRIMTPTRAAQLARAERFRHVVVRSHRQPDQHVDLVDSGREHEDVAVRERADTPADLHPVQTRQAQIQHHDSRIVLARQPHRRRPIGRQRDLEPLTLQVSGEHVRERLFIVDDERAAATWRVAAHDCVPFRDTTGIDVAAIGREGGIAAVACRHPRALVMLLVSEGPMRERPASSTAPSGTRRPGIMIGTRTQWSCQTRRDKCYGSERSTSRGCRRRTRR